MAVKSRYSLSTYLGLFFGFLFLIVITILSFTSDLTENAKKIAIPKVYIIPLLFLLIIYMLYRLFKTTPTIRIDTDKIKISGLFTKKIEVEKKDIDQIDLFSIGNVMGWITIVAKVKLVDNSEIIIRDPNYANKGELKQALKANFPEKIKPYKTRPNSFTSTPDLNIDEKISGNPFTSMNGVFLIAIFVAFIIMFLQKKELQGAHIVLGLPLAMLYFGFSFQLHYFVVSGNILIVKNHFLPWIKKKYKLDDIIAFNFEHPGKLSQSLRITTKDFKSHYYPAGSLREKHWQVLRNKIDEWGIHFIF